MQLELLEIEEYWYGLVILKFSDNRELHIHDNFANYQEFSSTERTPIFNMPKLTRERMIPGKFRNREMTYEQLVTFLESELDKPSPLDHHY